jgi:hypothetical protein
MWKFQIDRWWFNALFSLAIAGSLSSFAAASGGGGGHGGGGSKPAAHGGDDAGHGAPATADENAISAASEDGTRAVKLGEFSVRVFHSVSSRKDSVTFVLQARIKKDDFESFERLYPHRKIKVRDQVIVATRLVPIDDYDDPELTKFRRRIYLRLRRAIPELSIDDVYLSDFTLSVQST